MTTTPALSSPVLDKDLRPRLAQNEIDDIATRLETARRGVWLAVAIGVVAPLVPLALFWDRAAFLERLFDIHPVLGILGTLVAFVGMAAPFWAAVRVMLDGQALKRYRHFQADYEAFLRRPTHCPLNARQKTSSQP